MYPQLHEALGRLDALRGTDSDAALRQGPLDLDAVARRVLLLDPTDPVGNDEYGDLFRIALDPAMEHARGLATLAAFGLSLRGALAGQREMTAPDGTAYGRDWAGTPGESHGLVMDLDDVWEPTGLPDGQPQTTNPRPAQWRPGPGRPRPFVVVAGGTPHRVVVSTRDGSEFEAPIDVFTELLAMDPVLSGLPNNVPVLLVVPNAGGGQLELPRALADRLGRHVWSTSGNPIMQLHDDGTPVRIFLEQKPDVPRGDWIRSEPGEVLSHAALQATLSTQVTPTTQSSDVPEWERNLVSFTLVADGDGTRQIGRAEPTASPITVGARPGEQARHYNLHATPRGVGMPQKDGSTYVASDHEFTGWLTRRPSVRGLRDQDWIYLDSCWTGGVYGGNAGAFSNWAASVPPVPDPLADIPIAQVVANGTRKRVRAGDRAIAYSQATPHSPVWFAVYTDARGRPGRLLEFWPEPRDAELADLARTAGLHSGPGPVPRDVLDRTLRLVRALRHAFGPGVGPAFAPGIGQDPSYDDLLRGIGALELMRQNDPHLNDMGPFTLELFQRAALANLRDHGGGVRPPDVGAYRDLLARAAGASPGTRLTDFVRVPFLAMVTQRTRNFRDLRAAAIQVLRLDPGATVGPAEISRFYWAQVKSAEWFSSLPDVHTTALVALHLPAPDPSKRAELGWLATRAIAAGRDPYNVVELAAFHLEELGALDARTLTHDAHGRPNGRNWAPTSAPARSGRPGRGTAPRRMSWWPRTRGRAGPGSRCPVGDGSPYRTRRPPNSSPATPNSSPAPWRRRTSYSLSPGPATARCCRTRRCRTRRSRTPLSPPRPCPCGSPSSRPPAGSPGRPGARPCSAVLEPPGRSHCPAPPLRRALLPPPTGPARTRTTCSRRGCGPWPGPRRARRV